MKLKLKFTLPCVKKLVRGAVIGMLLLSVGCQSGAVTRQGATAGATFSGDRIAGSSATLVVHGMSCPLCAHNVDRQLMAVPGVTGVTLDLSTGEAKLTLDGNGRVTRKQLADAIDRSGFTLKEVRVP